jgi:tetraacyldisaccharide 4'-kinase
MLHPEPAIVELPWTPSGDCYRRLLCGEVHGLLAACLRGGLWGASVPYGWATHLRNRLYDRGWKRCQRVPVPVVSVGNLTLGGTGKTPCVEYVAAFYRQRRRRVSILSRGYGSTGGLNDEALLLRENLPDVPHYQGRDRVALATAAITAGSEVLVLDDGFQHRRLARDLDIVLVDATQPWGYGHLFPRGLLRESREGLRRAGVVLLTRCDQVPEAERCRLRAEVAALAPGVPLVESVHRPLELARAGGQQKAPLSRALGRRVAAFCGIGNPDAFRNMLHRLGLRVTSFWPFRDHHAYTEKDIADLHHWAQQHSPDGLVLTTQKDLVKLRLDRLGGHELWAVRIGLQIAAGQEVLDGLLHKLLETTSLAA